MRSPSIQHSAEDIDVFQIERSLWVAEWTTGLPVYEFPFARMMDCRHGRLGLEEVSAIGRFGAVIDYDSFHAELLQLGVRLVHSKEQHHLCSELPLWYPNLQGQTPESWWFDTPPDAKTAAEHAGWPLFLKGSRQTSRHRASFFLRLFEFFAAVPSHALLLRLAHRAPLQAANIMLLIVLPDVWKGLFDQRFHQAAQPALAGSPNTRT